MVAKEPLLKDTPEIEALRSKLLHEPLAFFRTLRDRLQADGDTRPESLVRLAAASYELGKLSAEIGDMRDALTAHRVTLAIRRQLVDAHSGVITYQSDLADSLNSLGILLSQNGQQADARTAFEAALGIPAKARRGPPDCHRLPERPSGQPQQPRPLIE